jgi:hypothetical protein
VDARGAAGSSCGVVEQAASAIMDVASASDLARVRCRINKEPPIMLINRSAPRTAILKTALSLGQNTGCKL